MWGNDLKWTTEVSSKWEHFIEETPNHERRPSSNISPNTTFNGHRPKERQRLEWRHQDEDEVREEEKKMRLDDNGREAKRTDPKNPSGTDIGVGDT